MDLNFCVRCIPLREPILLTSWPHRFSTDCEAETLQGDFVSQLLILLVTVSLCRMAGQWEIGKRLVRKQTNKQKTAHPADYVRFLITSKEWRIWIKFDKSHDSIPWRSSQLRYFYGTTIRRGRQWSSRQVIQPVTVVLWGTNYWTVNSVKWNTCSIAVVTPPTQCQWFCTENKDSKRTIA